MGAMMPSSCVSSSRRTGGALGGLLQISGAGNLMSSRRVCARLHRPPMAILASVHGIGGPEGTASPMWAGYIHLACHGSAGTPPMRKARSTWPGGALDASSERVTFREVMDFRTSARLVVPSACELGLGARSRGEGIQGLTRAGCLPGRVVASQWRVDDDATAEVMSALYLALLGHASGLPTQFRIGLSSRSIRGSCENPG